MIASLKSESQPDNCRSHVARQWERGIWDSGLSHATSMLDAGAHRIRLLSTTFSRWSHQAGVPPQARRQWRASDSEHCLKRRMFLCSCAYNPRAFMHVQRKSAVQDGGYREARACPSGQIAHRTPSCHGQLLAHLLAGLQAEPGYSSGVVCGCTVGAQSHQQVGQFVGAEQITRHWIES